MRSHISIRWQQNWASLIGNGKLLRFTKEISNDLLPGTWAPTAKASSGINHHQDHSFRTQFQEHVYLKFTYCKSILLLTTTAASMNKITSFYWVAAACIKFTGNKNYKNYFFVISQIFLSSRFILLCHSDDGSNFKRQFKHKPSSSVPFREH